MPQRHRWDATSAAPPGSSGRTVRHRIVGELVVDTGRWRWATCGDPAALLVGRGHVVKLLNQVMARPWAQASDLDGFGQPCGSWLETRRLPPTVARR